VQRDLQLKASYTFLALCMIFHHIHSRRDYRHVCLRMHVYLKTQISEPERKNERHKHTVIDQRICFFTIFSHVRAKNCSTRQNAAGNKWHLDVVKRHWSKVGKSMDRVIWERIKVDMYMYMCTCLHICIYIHACVNVDICMRICYVYMSIHMYAYIFML